MTGRFQHNPLTKTGLAAAITLLFLLLLPVLALVLTSSVDAVKAGVSNTLLMPALTLTLKTSLLSLVIIVVLGTPLAWWLSGPAKPCRTVVSTLIQLPIVIPPAVMGIGLLQAFGRGGLFGPSLTEIGLSIPFTGTAVVIAQVVVSAPFYIQAATNSFRGVDSDMMLVARTLGASPRRAFFLVALPAARPGLVIGAALAWSRALGEFGATLLFAGNLAGVTQTMPLAIFSAFESDSQLAVVFSLILAALGIIILSFLLMVTRLRNQTRST
ncbi:MAG: molybdate ABC transporter permease subunit [Myxococcota bacterium]|nr:molybdate ABC transporter permease subunit [Myxococcota bacterium]